MVRHTQTIRRQIVENCLSLFDHFVILKSILGPILFNLCVVDVVDASFLSTVALIRIVLTGIFEVFLTI